jgi:indolepyruvate ferredoxin oxidoreductase, alpha subunit
VNQSPEAIAKALGAGYVKTVNPYDLDETIETFVEARDYPGLSVVVAKQACVIAARRKGERTGTCFVNEKCVGCKVCIEFGCPAIEFEKDAAKINSLCSGCGVCSRICPNYAIEVVK